MHSPKEVYIICNIILQLHSVMILKHSAFGHMLMAYMRMVQLLLMPLIV